MAQPDATRLRPLGLGDLLDDLFALWRRGFLLYALINLCGVAPSIVLSWALGPDFPALFWVNPIIGAVLFVPALAAESVLTSTLYLGREAKLASVAQLTWRKRRMVSGLSLLWVIFCPLWLGLRGYTAIGVVPPSLLVGVPVALGVACLVAPWSLCVPVAMLEDVPSVRDALRRSQDLIRGVRKRSGFCLTVLASIQGPLVGIFYAMVWFGFHQLSGLDSTAAVDQLLPIMYVVSVLLPPCLSIGLTLLYYDRRVRAEGYDILLRAQQLGDDPRTGAG